MVTKERVWVDRKIVDMMRRWLPEFMGNSFRQHPQLAHDDPAELLRTYFGQLLLEGVHPTTSVIVAMDSATANVVVALTPKFIIKALQNADEDCLR